MGCCKTVCVFLVVTGWASLPVEGQPALVHTVSNVIDALLRASRIEVSIDFTKCRYQDGKTLDFIFSSQMDGIVVDTLYRTIELTGETSVNGKEYNLSVPVTRVIDMELDHGGSGTVFVADNDLTTNKTLSHSNYVCWIGKGAYFVRSTSGGALSNFTNFVKKSQEGMRFGTLVNFTKCNSSSELTTLVTDNDFLVSWEIRDYHFNEKGGVVFTKMSVETSIRIYRATRKVTMNPDGSADIVYTIYKEKPTAQSWHCPAGIKAFNLFELWQRY